MANKVYRIQKCHRKNPTAFMIHGYVIFDNSLVDAGCSNSRQEFHRRVTYVSWMSPLAINGSK